MVTDLASWRLVFWAYLPLTGALAAAIRCAVPGDRGPRRSGSLNTLAAAVFTAAVMAVVIGATVIARPGQRAAGAGVLLLAVPLTALFIKADRRATAPFLPAAVLRLPPLRRGAAGSFLNTAATTSAMTLATLYLQDTLHRSPLQAAATLVPFSLAVVAGSALAAPALRRIGLQPALATGLAVIATADAALTVAAPHPWGLPASAATAGAGLGLSSVAATTLGTTVPEVFRGTASGHQHGRPARHRYRHRRRAAHRGRHHRRPWTRHRSTGHRLGRRRCPSRSRSTSIHRVTASPGSWILGSSSPPGARPSHGR